MKLKDLLTEKKEFSSNIIAKAVKMKPIDARILVSKNVGDKNLMKAYQGLKDIESELGYAVKKDSVLNRLDLNLKDVIRKKYANAEEIKSNLNLFGM